MRTFKLLTDAATDSTDGAAFSAAAIKDSATVQASVSGTGSVSATVLIEVGNDGVNWLLLATITLLGTTSAVDGFASSAIWPFWRARTTALSAGALVNVSIAS